MNDKEEYIAYLTSRKSSHKVNYYDLSLREIKAIKQTSPAKPRLLIHACCGPCAAWPLEFLHDVFDITVFYNNSNIWPSSEYERRRDEMVRLIHEIHGDNISIVIPPYDNVAYTKLLAPRKDDPEGWKRCFLCYEIRLREGFQYAKEHGFEYFATVMTISRQKDSQKLNEIGLALSHDFPEVKWFPSDFKKKGGQQRRDEIVKEYNLYHQDYCGCVFSYLSTHAKEGHGT